MNDQVLEHFIIQNAEASPGNEINFSWHGGEPLMAGLGFFRKVVRLQRKYLPSGYRVNNGIQTNATLINSGWAKFLADEGFSVGISVDGPSEMHNSFRRTPKGNGFFESVLRGYEILRKNEIPIEVLCVVNSINVKSPLEVYGFFKTMGVRFITFLPLVEHDGSSPSGVSFASTGSREFGLFLSAIFDEWRQKDIGNLKVQIFEEALRSAFNQEHTLCIFKERCGGVPVLEYDGSFYSCDHYVDDEHFIGNILKGSIAEFLDSNPQKAFGDAKKTHLPEQCHDCPVLKMCNGECPKNRFIRVPGRSERLNYLCDGYKLFFSHCMPFADAVSAAWKLDLGRDQ